MTHPAIDLASVARLQDRLGRPEPVLAQVGAQTSPASPAAGDPAVTGQARSAKARAKAVGRRVATPVVARFRHELDRAVGRELGALRDEVGALREELARTRAEHSVAIAALQEELDAR